MKTVTDIAQQNCKLDDYDVISDILGCHKSLVKLYADAIIECSDENLRELLHTLMNECAADQFDAFRYMNANGMYETTCAECSDINCACEKYCSCSANCD